MPVQVIVGWWVAGVLLAAVSYWPTNRSRRPSVNVLGVMLTILSGAMVGTAVALTLTHLFKR
ncbi:MAG TPA: hypothetical protein VJ553_00935 [Candidatus Paceibacterota bacterium]|nr:hypothetical protein [Candidatus Paceibacterota bacterium]